MNSEQWWKSKRTGWQIGCLLPLHTAVNFVSGRKWKKEAELNGTQWCLSFQWMYQQQYGCINNSMYIAAYSSIHDQREAVAVKLTRHFSFRLITSEWRVLHTQAPLKHLIYSRCRFSRLDSFDFCVFLTSKPAPVFFFLLPDYFMSSFIFL